MRRFTIESAARYSLATLIVVICFGIFQLTQYNKEKIARINSVAKEHAANVKTQKQLIVISDKLDEATRTLQQAKIDGCNELNKAIKRQIATEFVRSANVMDNFLPQPRTSEEEMVADKFISSNVKTVRDANPYFDCSAKALGIIPLPKKAPGASTGVSPKEILAGIIALSKP